MLYPQLNKKRSLFSLDGFWRFKEDRENVGETDRWFDGLEECRELAVPGSWNEQCIDLFDFFGKGWYEKETHIPSEWSGKSVWLRIGSASMNAKVWINGQYVGEHIGPHLPFEFNITEIAAPGSSIRITVLVDDTLDPWSLPPARLYNHEAREGFYNTNPPVTYDFYPYGGIHRTVYIYSTLDNRIEDITIKTEVKGTSGIVHYCVAVTRPLNGELVLKSAGKEIRTRFDHSAVSEGSFEVEDARLWDIGQPNLYTAELEVYTEGSLIDCYKQTYGIRTVKVEGNKFLLNGKEVFFKGFGKHEDFFACGKGLNNCVTVKDFDLLKWIGANSFRTTHYPYAEEIIDFADKNGILVIDEAPFVGMGDRLCTPEILEKAKGVVKELVTRDKNHPCVVMWSLANEPWLDTPEGENFLTEIGKLTRALDTTRPITYVAYREPENNPALKHYDVVCINKYYGWYVLPGQIDQTLPDFCNCMDKFYETFKKPMIISEFGADAIDGVHTLPALMFSEEFQSNIIEKQFKALMEKDYCIGAHVWCFADFQACQTTTRIIYNRKGVFTRDRSPKMAAYKLKELWRD